MHGPPSTFDYLFVKTEELYCTVSPPDTPATPVLPPETVYTPTSTTPITSLKQKHAHARKMLMMTEWNNAIKLSQNSDWHKMRYDFGMKNNFMSPIQKYNAKTKSKMAKK